MQKFMVKFLNNLTNSSGQQFQCLQRAIPVVRAKSPERAIKAAQHQFEQLERVSSWNLRAQWIEVEPYDNVTSVYVYGAKRRPGSSHRPALTYLRLWWRRPTHENNSCAQQRLDPSSSWTRRITTSERSIFT